MANNVTTYDFPAGSQQYPTAVYPPPQPQVLGSMNRGGDGVLITEKDTSQMDKTTLKAYKRMKEIDADGDGDMDEHEILTFVRTMVYKVRPIRIAHLLYF